MSSDDLLAQDRAHLWHPFSQMKSFEDAPPLVIDRAQGPWLYGADGEKLLDGISSWWVNLLGHRHPRLDAALKAQIDRMAHVIFARFTHAPGVTLAAHLARLAPGDLDRVFYSDNGSTAVEVAMKMAYQFWKNQGEERPLFLAFDRAYHGDTLGAVAVGGVPAYHRTWGPLLTEVLRAPSPYAWPLPHGLSREDVETLALEAADGLLATRQGEVSAVIIEPLLQAAGGMATHSPAFLRRLRSLCDSRDVLLIFDEVATGFGRTGKLFAADHAQITPDLMAVSKAITGGYMPLGATLTTPRIYDAFYGDESKTFYHGHSYTGNALATALGCAVCEIISEPTWQTDLSRRSDRLQALWREKLSGLDHVADLRGHGSIVALTLAQEPARGIPYPPEEKPAHRVCELAREAGLFIRPLGHVIYLWPPLILSDEQMEWAVETIAQAIRQVTEH